jgi:hypothetical protein
MVGEDEVMVINLWCGPRSLSTATMYSFAQRPDTTVLDEPLYASHLHRNPHLYRPYRDEFLQQANTDGNDVLKTMQTMNKGKKIVFAKQITKQVSGLDKAPLFQSNYRNIFMIRDPFAMVSSWEAKNDIHQEGCNIIASSLPQTVELFSEVMHFTGEVPIVIDSDILKLYPEAVLREVCKRLNIDFFHEQLSWPPGPKPEIDG